MDWHRQSNQRFLIKFEDDPVTRLDFSPFCLEKRGYILANNTSLETLDLAYSGHGRGFYRPLTVSEKALLWGGVTHVESCWVQHVGFVVGFVVVVVVVVGFVVVGPGAHCAYFLLWLQGCALYRYRQRRCRRSVRRPTLQQDPEELEFEAPLFGLVWKPVYPQITICLETMMIIHGAHFFFRETCLLGTFGPGTFWNFIANTHGHWVAYRNLWADSQFLTT